MCVCVCVGGGRKEPPCLVSAGEARNSGMMNCVLVCVGGSKSHYLNNIHHIPQHE